MFLFFYGYIDLDGIQELYFYCMGRKGEKNLLLYFVWECYGMFLEIFFSISLYDLYSYFFLI